MSSHEYTVIPAPSRGEKAKGAKTGIERFAATLTDVLNQMARDGWDYVRAETLPAEERSGLTSRTTVYHNLLVFRRTRSAPGQQYVSTAAAEPQPAPAMVETTAEDTAAPEQSPSHPQARGPFSQPMRATPKPAAPVAPNSQTRARVAEPPLTAPQAPAPIGPRLGPASR